MQEVTPKVVAIAVNTVMTMWRIFPQSDLFSIVYLSYELIFSGGFETHCKDNTSMIGNVLLCPAMFFYILIKVKKIGIRLLI